MTTHDTIESRSARQSTSPASGSSPPRGWKNSSLRVLLQIFGTFALLLFATEAASGQGTDRSTKVANHLVELINAGDYAGIQATFNKNMDTALPLDKSSA